jgi:hypothetical protein
MYKALTAVGLSLALVTTAHAGTLTLDPVDITGIRNSYGTLYMLDFEAIKWGTEDRTVMQFDMAGLDKHVKAAWLNIPLANVDDGGPVGTISVHLYCGTGTIVEQDFYAGTAYTQFSAGLTGTYPVNVRGAIRWALDTQCPYLGFVLGAETPYSRYDLGELAYLPESTLTVAKKQCHNKHKCQ